MLKTRTLRTFVATSVLLFFLQGLRVIFSVLFGIIYDQVFEGPIDAWLIVSNLLVIAALIAPALTPRQAPGRWLAVFAVLAALFRVGLTVNDADIRYWGSLATLTFSGLYMSGLLRMDRPMFTTGLVSALAVDQLLRVVGHTYDLSLRPEWLPAQVLWAALVGIVTIWLSRRTHDEESYPGGLTWLDGLALGGFLFLEMSLLALPNGVARWSDTPYPMIAPLLIMVTLLPLIPEVNSWIRRICQEARVRSGLAAILVLGLLIGYFATGVLAGLVLLVGQAAVLMLLVSTLGGSKVEMSPAGSRLALGLFLFLLLNFFNAFAFTYPYVLPLMRGLGWAIYLAAGLVMGLWVVVGDLAEDDMPSPMVDSVLIGLASLAAVAISILAVWPLPTESLAKSGVLRAATYNIHYGYDDEWHFMLEEMAQAIEEADVDVVVLQEVDTGRITSLFVDDALYLAKRLRMNTAYLPTVEHLTGIALLYRGPAAPMDWRLLTSLQEQTGIVHVNLDHLGRPVHAYGIWMGLSEEDTERQIKEALDFIDDRSPATFGGDFNAKMGSPVADAVETAGFIDPFTALGIDPAPPTSPAIQPKSRIDFLWLRGLLPSKAWVSESLASDHRMVVVEVELP